MKHRRGLSLGLEAITFQTDNLLFKELTLAITALQSGKDYSKKAVDALQIPKMIANRTGLNITFAVDLDPSANAYVIPPQIDKNHVLIIEHWREAVGNKEGWNLAKAAKGPLKGSVDLKEGKVFGIFSEIVFNMFVTRGLIESTQYTAGEKAAIILHETGHLFTYCEFLGFTSKTNVILHAATEGIMAETDVVRKYEIINETSKVLGTKFEDPDALVQIKDKEVLQTVILRQALMNTPSMGGSSIYDLTGFEALSDQFATRHGAGRELITALDKMHKSYFPPAYQPTIVHLMLTAVKIMFFGFLVVGTWGLALILLMINPAIKLYDDPEARLSRIRREIVAGLKDRNIPAALRAKLIEDLEVVDAIIEPLNDKRGVLELIHTCLTPSGRRQYSQLKFQVDLEKLANNDLFITAAKLKALA